jgi:predicted outer membrane repeat protein
MLSGNTAGDGGGLFAAFDGAADIVNSTLSGNTANVAGGGVYSAGNVTLHNATLSGNTARVGGGGAFVYAGTLTVRRSLLVGNAAPTGREAQRFGGAVAAAAHNLFGVGGDAGLSGLAPGASDSVAPGAAAGVLLPLADNGGPTLTHALAPFSPAIDRAPSADCAAAPVGGLDQRGQPRNTDGDGRASANECDIGAVEAAAGSGVGAKRAFAPVIVR